MRYKTLGMLKNAGMLKDVSDLTTGIINTPYLLARDRQQHLVTVDPQGRLVLGGALLDTTGDPRGYQMFVMDGDGAIYSGSTSQLQHHSAFLAGGPVAAAGMWRVQGGALQNITNNSGHYKTPIDYAEQVLTELQRRGLNVHGVVKQWIGDTSKRLAKAAKSAGVTFERMDPKGVVNSRF